MEEARIRPPDFSEEHAVDERGRWQEPRLTLHGDLEEITGLRLLDVVSVPPDPGGDH